MRILRLDGEGIGPELMAATDGYDTALFLNRYGWVSERPGMCFFAVRKGAVITPSTDCDILESITRETIIQLFEEDLGCRVEERHIGRRELYDNEEAFFPAQGGKLTRSSTLTESRSRAGSRARKLSKCRKSTSTWSTAGSPTSEGGSPPSEQPYAIFLRVGKIRE